MTIKQTYAIRNGDDAPFFVTIGGREQWALDQLLAAREDGCTPIQNPAPRWAAYVFKLRAHGIDVETITEAHDGPYSGTHARYKLRSRVMRVRPEQVAA